tara:strand:- start:7548 stop:8273 length:726 start_codon:yes stop_codon:yes gene_type:complete
MFDELRVFYELLDELERRVGGKRLLRDCSGRMNWPERGVYFFFENGERQSASGDRPRVVRIGTHALKTASKTTIWKRLSQHKGTGRTGGGNHRGSIFRLLVGEALMRRDEWDGLETWGVKGDAGAAAEQHGLSRSDMRSRELPMEIAVSDFIGAMPFLWVAVNDEAGPTSDRGVIERNAIGLLSAPGSNNADPSSEAWLGRHSSRERVVRSGMWNNNHVGDGYDPGFLQTLERHIASTPRL